MRKKILMVEDNAEYSELLRMSLRRAGFAVSAASNGLEALKKARTSLPDLVLLDLVLPELDGFGVCEALRASRDTCAIPIIVLTGLTSEITRYAGLEAGATDYVSKPVSPKDLVTKIHYWLEQPACPASPTTSAPKPLSRVPASVY